MIKENTKTADSTLNKEGVSSSGSSFCSAQKIVLWKLGDAEKCLVPTDVSMKKLNEILQAEIPVGEKTKQLEIFWGGPIDVQIIELDEKTKYEHAIIDVTKLDKEKNYDEEEN